MALPNTGISTSMVAQAIGAGSNDVGALCNHANVNKWSKWKPVNLTKTAGVTLADLASVNYGLTVLSGINPQALKTACFEAGYSVNYIKPTVFRLGDFRNYEHSAIIPTHSGVSHAGLVVKKGASVYDNKATYMTYSAIEVSGDSETNVTVQNLYGDGTVYRGIMLINSAGDAVWKTGQIDWNVSPIKGWTGAVTGFVFYTNKVQPTFRAGDSADLDAIFYAVPVSDTKVNPFSISVSNDYGENSLAYKLTASAIIDAGTVNFSATFLANAYETSGGDLVNVQAILYNPATSQNVEIMPFGNYTLAKGTTKNYQYFFTNALSTYTVKIFENGVLIRTLNIMSEQP